MFIITQNWSTLFELSSWLVAAIVMQGVGK